MEISLLIAVYYYDGRFYVPTCVRSLDGRFGITDPFTIIPAHDRVALEEEIELKAIAGNATLSNAAFRAASDNVLVTAMGLPNRQAFYTRALRWSIIENDGEYQLIPFKPASLRGVVEDMDNAISLMSTDFTALAVDHMMAKIKQTTGA